MTFTPDYLLIDCSTFVFRAFHAMPSLVGRQGQPTGAIRGSLNQFNKMEKDFPNAKLVMVFDPPGPTQRNEIYQDYKANRVSMPEDLASQFDLIRSIVVAKGWPMIMMQGEEADDVIGSLAVMLEKAGHKTMLVSGDKDLAQLVNENTHFYNPGKFTLDEQGIKDHFGVPPVNIPDYLALAGDTVDNIPGVGGVGDKTALALLGQYENLDGIIQAYNNGELKVNKRQQGSFDKSITSHQIFLWKDLATIRINLDVEMAMVEGKKEDTERLNQLYRDFGFKESNTSSSSPSAASRAPNNEIFWELDYYDNPVDFGKLISEKLAQKNDHFGLFAIPEDPEDLNLGGAYLCMFFNTNAAKTGHLLRLDESIDYTVVNDLLSTIDKRKAITPYWKQTSWLLDKYGLSVEIGSDPELMGYILKSNVEHHWEGLAVHIEHYSVNYAHMVGAGKRKVIFSELADDRRSQLLQVWLSTSVLANDLLLDQLKQNKDLFKLYDSLEKPLSVILAQMEKIGVKLNLDLMNKVDEEIELAIASLKKECFKLAGKEFAIDSLNSLRQILFHDLKMPVLGKTPKGQASTSEDVLRELAEMGNKLPATIIEYRSLSKLRSTFTSKLPQMVNPTTGKIHSQWQQTTSISGRLTSVNPNLQQIPNRTEMSRQIRKAFVADSGMKLIKADYSQIELRIMAHYSKDPVLIKAFADGEDIHKATASKIFNVPLKDVTDQMRSQAKTVNFGLIYGISAYGLARQLNVTNAQAKTYIDEYFQKLARVADFMKRTPELAKKKGYVETLMKRRIILNDINHTQKNIREHAMRLAINAPLQGTSADITKLAMINFDKAIKKEKLDASIIMQIHDELVVQAPIESIEKVAKILHKAMVEAGKAVIKIPVLVEVATGDNYLETVSLIS